MSLKPLFVHNRKYIGSKQNLLPFIARVVKRQAPEARSVIDLFCGTAVVAHHFAARGWRVVANDMLYHNSIAAQCFLGAGAPVDWEAVGRRLQFLNGLAPVPGYVAEWFGGTYFTMDNAGRVDAIREQIAAWRLDGAIGAEEEAALLTSLIYAADKVANTCGQYDAYLKHLGADPYSAGGVHQVDATVYKPLELGLPSAAPPGRATVHCADANLIIGEIEADLLYLDPPYNTRQYVDNYHVLENITRWDKPALFGKTRKFERAALKSTYSRKRAAQGALADVIRRARCQHILLSYNNEGILSDDAILALLKERGTVKIFTQGYAIFGRGAGRSGRRPIRERLFYCRVEHPPIG